MFSEHVREEARRWEKRHKDTLKVNFTNKQSRKEVPWSDVPTDSNHWTAKKKRESKLGPVIQFISSRA